MTFRQWYVPRGRIPRRTWWLYYVLLIALLTLLAGVVDSLLGHPGFDVPAEPQSFVDSFGGPFGALVTLGTLVPSIAAMVARLHDRDHSAWWLLWFLVPVVGWILLFVQSGFLAGTPGPNRYGPDPGQPDLRHPSEPGTGSEPQGR